MRPAGVAVVAALLVLSACVPNSVQPEKVEPVAFAPWITEDDAYRIGPGDEIEVKLPFNGEYNDRVVVGPDGRFTLPLAGELRGEGMTVAQLTAELDRRYSRDLARPRVSVAIRAYASQKVFVGGEVNNAGLYNIPGRIGVMEAILMANGFMDSARTTEVVLIRRRQDGRAMMRTVNVAAYVAGQEQDIPIRAFDVIFVPKSTIAEVDQFVEQFINRVVPFQRGFTYTTGTTRTTQ